MRDPVFFRLGSYRGFAFLSHPLVMIIKFYGLTTSCVQGPLAGLVCSRAQLC
jgi:hypothetical protein